MIEKLHHVIDSHERERERERFRLDGWVGLARLFWHNDAYFNFKANDSFRTSRVG